MGTRGEGVRSKENISSSDVSTMKSRSLLSRLAHPLVLFK